MKKTNTKIKYVWLGLFIIGLAIHGENVTKLATLVFKPEENRQIIAKKVEVIKQLEQEQKQEQLEAEFAFEPEIQEFVDDHLEAIGMAENMGNLIMRIEKEKTYPKYKRKYIVEHLKAIDKKVVISDEFLAKFKLWWDDDSDVNTDAGASHNNSLMWESDDQFEADNKHMFQAHTYRWPINSILMNILVKKNGYKMVEMREEVKQTSLKCQNEGYDAEYCDVKALHSVKLVSNQSCIMIVAFSEMLPQIKIPLPKVCGNVLKEQK